MNAKRRRSRKFCRTSPLDFLPPAVKEELARRCEGPATYKEIVEWLENDHGCKTSDTAISEWLKRRAELRRETASIESGKAIRVANGVEIICEIRVSIIPAGHAASSSAPLGGARPDADSMPPKAAPSQRKKAPK